MIGKRDHTIPFHPDKGAGTTPQGSALKRSAAPSVATEVSVT